MWRPSHEVLLFTILLPPPPPFIDENGLYLINTWFSPVERSNMTSQGTFFRVAFKHSRMCCSDVTSEQPTANRSAYSLHFHCVPLNIIIFDTSTPHCIIHSDLSQHTLWFYSLPEGNRLCRSCVSFIEYTMMTRTDWARVSDDLRMLSMKSG